MSSPPSRDEMRNTTPADGAQPCAQLDQAIACPVRRERRGAVERLAARDPGGTVACLSRLLADPSRRHLAVDALGWIQTPDALAALAGALHDPAVGASAAKVMRRWGGAEAIPCMLAAYRQVPYRACDKGHDMNARTRDTIVAWLRHTGAPVVSRALGVLRREHLFEVARACPEEAVAAAARVLQEPSHPHFREVVRLLRDLRDPRAIPLLVPLWAALGELRSRRSISLVHRTLIVLGRDDPVRLLRALEERGMASTERGLALRAKARDRLALPALLRWASDRDSRSRAMAVEALGDLRERDAVSHVVSLLDDPDARLHSLAARTLGALGDPAAIEPLVAALDRPGPGFEAARALSKMGRPALARVLAASAGVREPRYHAMVIERANDVSLQREALQLASPSIRAAAATACGSYREIGFALGERLAAMLRSDPDPEVRRCAARALRHAQPSVAGRALQAAMNDPEARVREEAAETLRRRGA
ncbi:MAG: HEAT repeat domain-containing protein [Minicystis sp.]